MNPAANLLLHWVALLGVSPLLLGVIARVKACFAGRVGPPLLQPYFDIARLFRKNSVISRTTSWVFRATPVVALASVLAASFAIPFGGLKAALPFEGDVLLAVYFLALARFFMIAGAMDTGYSMEGMGASREAFFSCLSEAALFMNFAALSVSSQSLSWSRMVGPDRPLPWQSMGPGFLLVIASVFVILLAENCRIPVDDPDTHLELTMVHEVMILDHSGVDLAYLLYASSAKLFVFAAVLVSIVIPVQSSPVKDTLFFSGGVLGVAVLVGIVESTIARFRLNRVKNLLLIAFALAFFGFVVTLWRR
jgi:formate hydrogenlyase subunit 4